MTPKRTMKALDEPTAGLVRVALEIPDGPEAALTQAILGARKAGTESPSLWELVLSAVLFAGFPRALVAARMMRRLTVRFPDAEDSTNYDRWKEWLERGEKTCRIVYGDNYYKLRDHVAHLHPALDHWMIVDGYGRTLGRPGLDLARRELCAVAMLIEQDVPRQLHSHYRGALNAGATRAQIAAVLELAAGCSSVRPGRLTAARALFAKLGGADR